MDLFKSFLVFSAIFWSQANAEDECKQKNPCECEFTDGTGYNLNDLFTGGTKFLEAVSLDKNLKYFYNCNGTKELPHFDNDVQDNCSKEGYMLCRYDKAANKTEVLGKDSVDFKISDGHIILNYVLYNNVSTVLLECAPNSKREDFVELPAAGSQNSFVLYSKLSCTKMIDEKVSHGVVYIIFIILLTFLFLYLFFGILINYFLIGARGYELVPNYDFWCKVWRSAKLGFVYLKNGCRVIPAEDSYDAI